MGSSITAATYMYIHIIIAYYTTQACILATCTLVFPLSLTMSPTFFTTMTPTFLQTMLVTCMHWWIGLGRILLSGEGGESE